MEQNTKSQLQDYGLHPKFNEKGLFYFCPKCGKRIIERLPNGLWKFIFGSDKERRDYPPVIMYIHGNIKMKCLRRKCDQFIILNFFDFSDNENKNNQSGQITESNQSISRKTSDKKSTTF